MQFKTDNRVFIGFGSNLGESRQNLTQASGLLEEALGVTLVTSSFYRSEPVEVLQQPWFWNQVGYFEAPSGLTSTGLLEILKAIEREMGRQAGPRYGPRVIDLDILFFKDWVFECGHLSIPHPKLAERSFVLYPLAELDISLIHPACGLSIGELIQQNQSILTICERYADEI